MIVIHYNNTQKACLADCIYYLVNQRSSGLFLTTSGISWLANIIDNEAVIRL